MHAKQNNGIPGFTSSRIDDEPWEKGTNLLIFDERKIINELLIKTKCAIREVSKLLVVIDRIEGDLAVIELPDRSTKDVPLVSLPNNVKQGDCFWFKDDRYIPAPDETVKRKVMIDKLSKSLLNE